MGEQRRFVDQKALAGIWLAEWLAVFWVMHA